jgi:hypothetical protein
MIAYGCCEKQNIQFIVLMAAPGTAVDELLTQQNYLAGKLAGMSEEQLLENKTKSYILL